MHIKVATLIENQYQDLEVWFPALRLKEEGFEIAFVGTGTQNSYNGKYGYPAKEDLSIKDANIKDFDAVIVPGGFAPDFLRRHLEINNFVRDMFKAGKLVAAICHGPWVLISAGILKGKKATCFSGIKDDVANAGADYIDAEVVVDANLITSRKPEDLPAFCREIIEYLKKPK